MNKNIINSIDAIKVIELPYFVEENGELVVIEGVKNVPFQIARVFIVSAENNAIRGRHAHKSCAQFLMCSMGAVEVLCTDGIDHINFLLNRPEMGLFIPPSIWAEQEYKSNDAVLTVLCDEIYDENDYIRDFSQYELYRSNNILNKDK